MSRSMASVSLGLCVPLMTARCQEINGSLHQHAHSPLSRAIYTVNGLFRYAIRFQALEVAWNAYIDM